MINSCLLSQITLISQNKLHSSSFSLSLPQSVRDIFWQHTYG